MLYEVITVGTVGNDIYNYSRYAMDANMLNPDYKNRWTPRITSYNVCYTKLLRPISFIHSVC